MSVWRNNDFKSDKKLKEYRQEMDELNEKAEQIKNADKWSADYKKEKVEEVKEKAKQKQQQAKESYLKAVDRDIEEVKKPLQDEVPEKLKSLDGMELSKTEIKSLGEQYNDNYWAKRKLNQKAKEQDLNIYFDTPNIQKKVDHLKKKKNKAGRKFNSDPLNDGEQQRLKNIVKNA